MIEVLGLEITGLRIRTGFLERRCRGCYKGFTGGH